MWTVCYGGAQNLLNLLNRKISDSVTSTSGHMSPGCSRAHVERTHGYRVYARERFLLPCNTGGYGKGRCGHQPLSIRSPSHTAHVLHVTSRHARAHALPALPALPVHAHASHVARVSRAFTRFTPSRPSYSHTPTHTHCLPHTHTHTTD